MPIKFEVVAHLSRPIAGKSRPSTRDQGVETVYAETPEAAARMWFWRLSADERAVVDRIIVWPPKLNTIIATYQGDTVVYRREGGKLVEVERRANPLP